MSNQILTPRRIAIGGGSIRELPGILKQLGIRKPLLVVDPRLHQLGIADPVVQALRAAGIDFQLFTEVIEDPDDASVQRTVEAIRRAGHDGLVGIGGGSAIDTAKAAAIVAALDEPVRALMVPRIVDEAALPVVAIPTTAGTGSEVTRACVITDSASREKMLILGMACLPTAAIVDYELTLSCPFRVSADTGLDALTHALEALVNRNRNPYADALALSALQLIGKSLVTACREPQNQPAREAMMMGAMHAGLAVSNTSTALVHGMSRQIGALFHVPHGLSNAMLLPAVTEFSASAAPQPYAAAARALGWATALDSDTDAIDKLIAGFWNLNATLEVPTPAEFGIDHRQYHDARPMMAELALSSGTPANNPRLASKNDIIEIYTRAWTRQAA